MEIMKTLNKKYALIFTAAFLVVITLNVRAFDNMEVIIEENSSFVQLKMTNPAVESMNVFLLNQRDRVIQQDRIEHLSAFEQSYDFSELKDGTYTLVSQMQHMRYNKVLEVRDNQVEMTDAYYSFTPVFKMKDDMILVNYLLNGSEDIAITVKRYSKPIFHGYYGNNEYSFEKIFSLEDLPAGDYSLQLASNKDTYAYDFSVE
jgi:hypothetical protein